MKKYIDFILEKSDDVIKLIDFPNLRQSTTFTCGAVATQAIFTNLQRVTLKKSLFVKH